MLTAFGCCFAGLGWTFALAFLIAAVEQRCADDAHQNRQYSAMILVQARKCEVGNLLFLRLARECEGGNLYLSMEHISGGSYPGLAEKKIAGWQLFFLHWKALDCMGLRSHPSLMILDPRLCPWCTNANIQQ